MKLNNQSARARKSMSTQIRLKAALLGLLASVCTANAQEVFMPRQEFPVTPPALQQIQNTNGMQVFTADELAPPVPHETQPFKWGLLTLRPHPSYRFLYGNGIQASTNNPQTTVIQEISPGFLLAIGSHWTLDYTPTWRLYSQNQFRNTLDHAVKLTGGGAYEDWIFGLSQSYVSASTPLAETGTQTDLETYLTGVNASYRFNSKMTMDLAVSQKLIFADKFESSREWSTLDWLNYEIWPRFEATVGAGFGYVNVDTGPDMTYEQFQGGVNWRATDKISFQVHGGVEDRQFLSGGASDVLNPVFGVAVQYQPFEVTKLLLGADRAVSASYFQNETTETTRFRGDLNQRLFNKLYLDLGGAYQTVKYISSANSVSPNRSDDYYSFNVQLSRRFLKRGNISVFYQISGNSSTQPGFSYSSSQFGFEVGYQY